MKQLGREKFLRATRRLNPVEFLANRRVDAVVVAEDSLRGDVEDFLRNRFPFYDFIQRLRRVRFLPVNLLLKLIPFNFPFPHVVRAEDLEVELSNPVIARQRAYFACSLVDERALRDRIRALLPQARVFGLVNDAMTEKAARIGKSPMSRSEILKRAESLQPPSMIYAVACTPRSGSTFLCSLIASNDGYGAGDEHLKNFVLFMYRHRRALDFDPMKWFRYVLAAHTDPRTGIFGTKLISDYVVQFIEMFSEQDKQEMAALLQGVPCKLVYLVRDNKASQAVSMYLASQTKVWHLKDDKSRQRAEAAAEKVDYDFDAIHERHEFVMEKEAGLKKLVDEFDGEVLTVHYEDLVADTPKEMARIMTWLDPEFDLSKLAAESPLQPVSKKTGNWIKERYAREIAEYSEREVAR